MGSYLSDTNAGLNRGGYGLDGLGRPTGPGDSHVIPDEDPGERVVQSFTAPRGDSRATAVTRPASGLLAMPDRNYGMGNGANLYEGGMRGRYGYGTYIGESGGYPRTGLDGLGKAPGEPVYDNDVINVRTTVPLSEAGARADFSGAYVVAPSRWQSPAQQIVNALPGAKLRIVPEATENEAINAARGKPEFTQVAYDADQAIRDVLDNAAKVVTLGTLYENPILYMLHDTNVRFQEGRHIWSDWDSSADPFMALEPFTSGMLYQRQFAGVVNFVPNAKEYRENMRTADAPSLPFESVAVLAANPFRVKPDGRTRDTDLGDANMERAVNTFLQEIQPYTAGMTSGNGQAAGIGTPMLLAVGGVGVFLAGRSLGWF